MNKKIKEMLDINNFNLFTFKVFLIFILLEIFVFKHNLKSMMIIFLVLIICFIIEKFFHFTSINYLKKRFSNEEINKIYSEFKSPIFKKNNAFVFTDNYIIIQSSRPSIIKYSDIVLIYNKIVDSNRYFFFTLVIYDYKGKKIKIYLKDELHPFFDNDEFLKFQNLIVKKNNNVLVGLNKKNVDILKDKYNLNIKNK